MLKPTEAGNFYQLERRTEFQLTVLTLFLKKLALWKKSVPIV